MNLEQLCKCANIDIQSLSFDSFKEFECNVYKKQDQEYLQTLQAVLMQFQNLNNFIIEKTKLPIIRVIPTSKIPQNIETSAEQVTQKFYQLHPERSKIQLFNSVLNTSEIHEEVVNQVNKPNSREIESVVCQRKQIDSNQQIDLVRQNISAKRRWRNAIASVKQIVI